MSRQAYPLHLSDHLGNEVRLPPRPFAVGGEGAVFDVQGRPDLVAKLYSKPQSKERCEKLRAMAKLCSPDLLKIAAWPTATLNAGNPATINGILMPRVADYLEIHHLYSVAQRKKDFPEVDWGFLLHTARNCAIAFETVHSHGHVVGDVNQKNVMVSKKGIVAFVDCDSFQIVEGSRIFRCGVGVPEYTPPELHGKNFTNLDRAANHDFFGLAVLIFHLLMMGRHPFSGVPLVSADMPIEKAIQEGCYAYTRDKSSARLKPPPLVPPMTMLDPTMLDLFDRAFGKGRRPTATEWRTSLDAAMKQLVRCKNDPRHSYMAIAGKCPWCELIATARLMYFLPGHRVAAAILRLEDIQSIIDKFTSTRLFYSSYTRPKASSPIRILLPAGLRAPSRKPTPTSYPLIPLVDISQAPSITPHPRAPIEPTRPRLNAMPVPPTHPPLPPPLSPSNPLLPRLSIVGMIVGFCIIPVFKLLGFILIPLFATLLGLILVTQNHRREMIRAALNVARQSECERMDEKYAKQCAMIEEANVRKLDAWQSAKIALAEDHIRACKEIDDEDRRKFASWEATNAALVAGYDRSCRQIDATNRRLIADWEAANSAWLAEERHWLRRANEVTDELETLEANLLAERSARFDQFEERKREAQAIVSTYYKAKHDYDDELRQAEADSKRIQIDEHLDKALIRHAKLNGITNERVLALESFGIETAKDVSMLKSQKVPGIGPILSARLFIWRDGLATTFAPKQPLPESEKIRIANRFAPIFLPLVQNIQVAINNLEGIIGLYRNRERELLTAIGSAVQDVANVEAHLDALERLP